jgi:ribonuclease P protein component
LTKIYFFPKNRKLKTDEISSVFNFRCQFYAEYFRILIKPNQLEIARFAAVVSKKTIRGAVERNYCKRIIREFFRVKQDQMVGLDLVILTRKKFSRSQFEIVKNEFDSLLSKLPHRVAKLT